MMLFFVFVDVLPDVKIVYIKTKWTGFYGILSDAGKGAVFFTASPFGCFQIYISTTLTFLIFY